MPALEEFSRRRQELMARRARAPGLEIYVGMGTCGLAAGAQAVWDAVEEQLRERGISARLVRTGCIGMCESEPLLDVVRPGEPRITYGGVSAEAVPEIVEKHVLGGYPVEEHVIGQITDPARPYQELPFYAKQRRLVLARTGFIDPRSIEDYLSLGGYGALLKVLTSMTPEQVIAQVTRSGLRGRGGAGFPTGRKWEATRSANSRKKYVVCNGDEGDPGAFMDRSVLEGDPHAVLEGMMIAAYAIGADEGYLYIRAEYPMAVRHVRMAIEQARECGLLGEHVLGTGFSLDLHVKEGAGAFVCGEETALLASIQGERGMPRPRPPFPAQSGLWGCPTNINNVETYANVPAIMTNGAEWFAHVGTERSKGSKVFSLAGKVARTGLAEVPMGMSLGELIFDVGGGISGGKKFKGVQIGGPSGGCLPPELLNTPIDYDSLTATGAIMGSGGLVVLDEDTCMVDLARFFLNFTQSESCGKCTPCREGTKRMLEILTRICQGKGEPEDLGRLEKLALVVKDTSLCGLGQTAPNPVLTTLRYFRHEYEAHVIAKRCPASVCAWLFTSPCQNACPAGIDIPIYLDHIRNGRFREAYFVIKRDNPLAAVCGRVCDHPCEGKCRRGQLDDPLAIRLLKRAATDWVLEHDDRLPNFTVRSPRGVRVAVVGSGPAGLSCAHYLALKGYQVTVFEALPVLGGMLRTGIPEYRLPRRVLDAEIQSIIDLGIEVRTGVRVGDNPTLEDLKQEGFPAIFLALGAQGSPPLGVPGDRLEGVYPGVEFLRRVNLGRTPDLTGKRVVVVGGGNVAIDAARTSLRLGAYSVRVVYRRRREDMPAIPEEVTETEREGIGFTYLAAPVRVAREGRVSGVVCRRMALGDFDRDGRRRPLPEPDSEFTLDADVIISAIGQAVESAWGQVAGLRVGRGGVVDVDARTLATGVEGVFAGGDCVSGPATVIEAVAAGKRAAAAIDRYLGGDGEVVPGYPLDRRLSGEIIETTVRRHPVLALEPDRRARSFAEVECGYPYDVASAEAARCLRCDVK
ncbi:MAG: NADH-ubiquinone oxidoreductase-F iron-sulfur binding region domain-containing protein [Bacillota bacterium]